MIFALIYILLYYIKKYFLNKKLFIQVNRKKIYIIKFILIITILNDFKKKRLN